MADRRNFSAVEDDPKTTGRQGVLIVGWMFGDEVSRRGSGRRTWS
jgi:hypothetical protein